MGFGQKNINPIIESENANVKILNAFVDTFPNISIYLITEKIRSFHKDNETLFYSNYGYKISILPRKMY
tara:strand:+ start:83 stop:289 length:207 start_codon:yes stop_codon:yes gene_type:complete